MLLRPMSGSASLALVEKLLAPYGADSRVGLVASTVMGSSETIFYTVCVYMSAIDRKSTGYAVPARSWVRWQEPCLRARFFVDKRKKSGIIRAKSAYRR